MESLARTILDERDYREWQQVPESDRRETFFRTWTRKEARCKADGSGISEGVSHVRVPLTPMGEGSCHKLASSHDRLQWCLSDWAPFGEASSAVVIEALPGEFIRSYRDCRLQYPDIPFDIESQPFRPVLVNAVLTKRTYETGLSQRPAR